MPLSKVRAAEKKARHEHKRQVIRNKIARKRGHVKVSRKRAREMFIKGRKEYQAKRAADKDYVANLEAEIKNEQDQVRT
jgi:hypothetical protein